MKSIRSRTGAVLAATAAVLAVGSVGSAVAANLIDSQDILNNSIQSVDLHNHGIHGKDLATGAVGMRALHSDVKTEMGKGKVSGLEADGPYPSLTKLQQGDNSTKVWAGDNGATLQTSWVMCKPGKLALGGGYSRADEAIDSFKSLQIVSSRPAVYKDGKEQATWIKGDPDMSIQPNAWVVEGFNLGTTDLVVRPWIICASIAK
jgi:hypothetical protein